MEDKEKIKIQLQNQFLECMKSLYLQGFLDAQFVQLQKLQDESSPEFVLEVVSLFFEDSEKLLNNLVASLQVQVVDFKQVDAFVHQLKGSSSSLGAQRVKNACVSFRNCCEEKDLQGCKACLQHLKDEYFLVKNHLGTLCRLERKLLAAGGKVPVLL